MSVQDLIDAAVELFKNKKIDEAIETLNEALDGIEDKDSQIQQQNDIQFWLGRCYFEQAIKTKRKDSKQFFGQAVKHFQQKLVLAKQLEGENGIQEQYNAQFGLGRCYLEQARKAKEKNSKQFFEQAVKHFQQRLVLAKQLEGKNGIQKQINALSWLGRCYLEQAMKAEEEGLEQLFDQAVKYHKQQLVLAKQLEGENSIRQQSNVQSWLGRCYLEQAIKTEGKDSKQNFNQAVKHHKLQLVLAKQLEGENSIQEQNNAQHWLGRCYFVQALKAKGKGAKQMFDQAVEHLYEQLTLAKKLEGENSIQEQINAQSWLGSCYLEQALKAEGKDTEQLFGQAIEYYQTQLGLIKQLTDKQTRLRQQNNAQFWLGRCYFEQAIIQKKWERYFEWKKQKIQGDLFETKKGDLINAITTILAVLNIPPMELGAIPLAHYTSPSVCERLFGIVSDKTNDEADNNDPVDNNNVSPMRIGSSTYMNDPTEGEGLLELLNLQDLELENKADSPVHNAFFTCFSSRVNDLNQFRLYGKENGVEASGCCLVFNKSGDWLKEPDVSASFGGVTNKQNGGLKEPAEVDVAGLEDENLPLYQVAYIAYYDEYIAKEKCTIWLPDIRRPKFGIRLKPVGKNLKWHKFRIKELRAALTKLIKNSNQIKNEDGKALEYIRYLFKDFAFRDEEEFRLLKIEQIGSDKIEYCEATKSVYLPYTDICYVVDEVILGTNYEKSGKERKAEVFQHLMRNHYRNVKVSRSSLPINANPPIKKD